MPNDGPLRFARHDPDDPAPPPGDFPLDRAYVLTRDAVREVDRRAVEDFGLPSIVLMENAALALAAAALGLLVESGGRRVLIVCGPGSNGGDGLALARHLHNAGAEVRVALAGRAGAYRGDASINLEIAERMGLAIADASEGSLADAADPRPDLVVDALFGTGLARPLEGAMGSLVAEINALRARGALILAVDLPSGLDADRGEVLGVAVRADLTVTLAGVKPGLLRLEAQEYVGELIVGDIGCPRELIEDLGDPIEPPPGAEE